MLVNKKDNKTNDCKQINFMQFIKDYEQYTGYKQNRRRLNFRLYNQENFFCNRFTYFLKI